MRHEFETKGQADVRSGTGTPGCGQLYINDKPAGTAASLPAVLVTFGIVGLSCGYDAGEAATHKHLSPFRFTATINKVVTDISGEPIKDGGAQVRMQMVRQPVGAPIP